MILDIAVLLTVLATGIALLNPKLSRRPRWRAMITPLASIIGSGFLVLGPILDASYGRYAPLVMAVLCIGAYLFGWTIRYNIAALEAENKRSNIADSLELLASWALTFAFVISVAYYLNLFGAFGVSLTPFDNAFNARILTSVVFLIILVTGWWKGFKALESMEYVSVALKLAIIAGVLMGLAIYFSDKASNSALVLNPANVTGMSAITLAFGLIITVQGFETSRYLGGSYDPATRISSMKLAQWISAAIYMTYLLLISYVFTPGELEFSETAIISMMRIVAPILPPLLVAAALAAQFSAAIADTSGSGGLFVELTRGRITARQAYALLVVIGLLITWTANVFEIIAYASRAFAVYYALQAAIAAKTSIERDDRKWKSAAFAALALLGVLIAVFGQAVEG